MELSVRAGEAIDTVTVEVEANPVTALELLSSSETARTGDVVRFTGVAKNARGLAVRGVPVQYGVAGTAAPTIIASGAAAMITDDGRFVAERSGTYTVVATVGTHSAAATIGVDHRDIRREVELVGRGRVVDRHSSDLWIWEGIDGRDYAITGDLGFRRELVCLGCHRPGQDREAPRDQG